MITSKRGGLVRTLHAAMERSVSVVAIIALVIAMSGTWMSAADAEAAPLVTATKPDQPAAEPLVPRTRATKQPVTGRINLNTATEDQLVMLPTVGPAKAERIVTWRKKNGGFRRTADLRRVKGFGYKTFKRLEPLLAVTGETTLAVKR